MSATAAVVAVRDHTEMLRIGDVLDEDHRPGGPAPDRLGLSVLEDVVAETDDELLARGERSRHSDHLGDPAGRDLHLVGEIELEEHLVAGPRADVAVAEQVDELAGVLLAGDEQHLGDAGALQQLQRVVDHRPPAHREQVLVRDARQFLEARRRAAGGDQSFHEPFTRAMLRQRPRRRGLAQRRDPVIPAMTPSTATHIHITASP